GHRCRKPSLFTTDLFLCILTLSSVAVFLQFLFQILVSLLFFFFGKVRLPELLRIVLIHKNFISELLACQIEAAVSHYIVAVKVSVRTGYAVHLSAENILCQESGDGTLAQCSVLPGPVLPHPRRAGIRAPDLRQSVIQIDRGVYPLILVCYRRGVRMFPSPESVSHMISSSFLLKTNPEILPLHHTDGFDSH